jgi:histone-lysine N-methyltransferase SETD3
MILVQSRVFGITVEGKEVTALVPVADMLNHNIPCQVRWFYDDARRGFVMKAEEDIPRGDQVYDSYGNKDDSTFLMNYGFLPPTKRNRALIIAYLNADDPYLNDKQNLLRLLGIGMQSYTFMETLEDQDVFLTFGWFRFIVFKEEDTDGIAVDLGKLLKAEINYVSLTNEIKMWQRIK